jgi:hypothetical protein
MSFFLLSNGLPVFSDPWVIGEMMSSLTEKIIELELRMKYPGEDLSEIDREYNILSERLRVLELKQQRDADEVRGVDLSGHWTQNELVNLVSEF